MLKHGILNPALLELLARFRHTNTLVIADRGFPYYPQLPTVDISLIDNIPTVRQVLAAISAGYVIGAAWMAKEALSHNPPAVIDDYRRMLAPVEIRFEGHYTEFKPRVPGAIGIIRTGDTTQFGNIILESS